ncbi:MAG: hydroxyphenylacetyl-CoA thioesterase PaaI [Vulcanimicrobiaceae bacterium]
MSPQQLAEASAAAMYARDAAAKSLGITIDEVASGYARLSMDIASSMLNGHDFVHGGLIFTLADTAFAYACNSRNERNVALGAQISFVAPGRVGTKLSAVARERSRAGRTGVFDVEVQDEKGETIALFRGTSYRIDGTVI